GVCHVKGLPYESALQEAITWAERLGIRDQLHKYPNALSGGQRQRVAIARAVIMEPAFLLLDEITSALDPVLAGEIADLLTHLKERGIGIVLVTHQIDFIRRNGDQVYFLRGGEFKEQGPPLKVLS